MKNGIAQEDSWGKCYVIGRITRICGLFQENTEMDNIFEQLKGSNLTLVIVGVGVVALFLALKIGHVVLKFVFGLIGLAAIVVAVWWFFLRH